LATTTSTQDSGLLEILVPLFQRDTGYFVKTIAVGSGQAMKFGERGEADVLLVHSPEEEQAFMIQGFGISRRLVMYNDFILVGPAHDPAQVKGLKTVSEAFKAIARTGALFLSRGDNSGTHAKEKAVWKGVGGVPEGQKWYHQTGLGMGPTLQVAAEKQGYTLSDRGTYLALKKNLGLEILLEGDPSLLNSYHIIVVHPTKGSRINTAGAQAFFAFLVSSKVQKLIGEFGKDSYRTPLFFPAARIKREGGLR